jgi:Arc/MetJ-type ribon-helix-helix transcriptional regulator
VPVRLDDDDVEVLDQLVRLGLATDRSDAIRRGIDRDRRWLAAVRDASSYARSGDDPDLSGCGRDPVGRG